MFPASNSAVATEFPPSVSAPYRQCLLRDQGTPNCSLHNLSWFSFSLLSLDHLKLLLLTEKDLTLEWLGESDLFLSFLLFLTVLLNSLSSFFFMHKHWGSQSLCSLWAHPWQPCYPNNLLGSLLLFPSTPHSWGCFTLSFSFSTSSFPSQGWLN